MNWFLVVMGVLVFAYGVGFALTLITSCVYRLRALKLWDGGFKLEHLMDAFENPGTLFLDALQSWYRLSRFLLWDFKEQREIVDGLRRVIFGL